MSLEDKITRDDILQIIIEEETKRNEHSNVTDYIGHTIYLCTNYTTNLLIDKFNIEQSEIYNYKRKK